MCCWILFNTSLRIFAPGIFVVFFSHSILTGFDTKVRLVTQIEFGSVPSSLIFLEEFEKECHQFLFKWLVKLTSETIMSWIFLLRKRLFLFYYCFISLLIIGLRLFISSWLKYNHMIKNTILHCIFWGIYPFLLEYPICWCISVHSGKFLKRWNTRPPDLPPEKSVCRSKSNS